MATAVFVLQELADEYEKNETAEKDRSSGEDE